MARVESSFDVMGSRALVCVSASSKRAAAGLAAAARTRLESLHSSWTRFDEASPLVHLNRRAGQGMVEVSSDVLELVDAMVDAFEFTDGRCNPSAVLSMHAAGYAVSYGVVPYSHAASSPVPFASMREVHVDRVRSRVSLPAGVAVDPGSIGKGMAASWVASDLLGAGATGVLVDVGGDLAVAGRDGSDPWRIGVADELRLDGDPIVVLEVEPAAGSLCAAATSSVSRRRLPGGHHVLDPLTGQSLAEPLDGLVAATVVMHDTGFRLGARVEALATAVLVEASRSGDLDALARAATDALVLAQRADGRLDVRSARMVAGGALL